MITIKNKSEIQKMRKAGQILAKTLSNLKDITKPGLETIFFDTEARKIIKEMGGEPSFLGYKPSSAATGFPSSICVSINDELVHGLPGRKKMQDGDIVSLDLGVSVEGYHTDGAITFGVGKISENASSLLSATIDSLWAGIHMVKPGAKVGDISFAVEDTLKAGNYGIVRDLVGHGIGREIHEDPPIPNFGQAGNGPELKEGMTICIEPMVSLGDHNVTLASDGWTYVMKDGSLCAHFEHTVLVTQTGYEILTEFGE